jgi:hypothetical protein
MLDDFIRQKWLDWDKRREEFLKMKKGEITKEQFKKAVESLRDACRTKFFGEKEDITDWESM